MWAIRSSFFFNDTATTEIYTQPPAASALTVTLMVRPSGSSAGPETLRLVAALSEIAFW
jgi:hypothetical protein